MKRVFYFIIGIVLLISCEKETEIDNIIYTDIQPDKELTTIGKINLSENNIVAFGNWTNDTIISFALSKTQLDLNNDGVQDYTIEIKHELTDSSHGIYSDKFIMQLNSGYSNPISLSDKNMGYIKSYENGQVIDTSTFAVNGNYSMNTPGGFLINKDLDEDFQLIGDFYVAVKLNVDNKQFYGWIHIKVNFFKLVLCDYAISNKPNELIKIGQIK